MAGVGFYRKLFRVEMIDPAAPARTAYGQDAPAYKTRCRIRGMVHEAAKQSEDDGGPVVRRENTATIAFHPGVTETDRLVELPSGRVWDIAAVIDPDGGRRRRLTLALVRLER